jgi:hypothetical protein
MQAIMNNKIIKKNTKIQQKKKYLYINKIKQNEK